MNAKLKSTHVDVRTELYRVGSLPPLYMGSKYYFQACIFLIASAYISEETSCCPHVLY